MVDISVVMSVYNLSDEHILLKSINSILDQTYSNFELIICDDASTDKTYELIKKIVKNDFRVKLLKNEVNLKAGGARNKCIEISKGEFIAIMDSDDYSEPTRLEKQINFLKKNPQFSFVGTQGNYFEVDLYDNKDKYWFCKYPKKQDFLFTLPFVHASIMFRRDVLKQVNGYSSHIKVNRSEDYDLLMRLYKYGYRGANIEETLYFIRKDKNTFKRRKYRYRINEAIVKCEGFIYLGLMPKGIFYALKPLIVGLIPINILNKLKERYYINK